MTGIDYPTITIGERTLVVRFSLYAQYLLSQQGVDLRKPLSSRDPGYLAYRLAIFAAAVAQNYPAGKAPTAEQWALDLDGSLDRWADIEKAIGEAMGKASEELRAGLAAVPLQQTAS